MPQHDLYYTPPNLKAEINMIQTRSRTQNTPTKLVSSPSERRPRKDRGNGRKGRPSTVARSRSLDRTTSFSRSRSPSAQRRNDRSRSQGRSHSRDRNQMAAAPPARDRGQTRTGYSDRRSRSGPRTPRTPHSRSSSTSRDRHQTHLREEMKKLNHKLSKAVTQPCSKCGGTNHRSRQCRTYPDFCPTRCSCGYFHKESECNKKSSKPFWKTNQKN